jgi:hypothetical protein
MAAQAYCYACRGVRPWLVFLFAIGLAACKGGYQQVERPGEVNRGETNGRMFDFVANLPDGDDWQIRVRGTSLWVSYSDEDSNEELGARDLSAKDAAKLWKLIDEVDVPEREDGDKDEDEGYYVLRLREPGGDEGHDVYTSYESRDTEDDDVIALARFFETLVKKYHGKKPEL